DVVQFRAEGLEADLQARDLTVDALAVRLADLSPGGLAAIGDDDIVDPTGGREDLQAGILRLTSPQAIGDDPLRALRTVRLACELDMRIDPTTLDMLGTARVGLEHVAAERVGGELE